MKLPLLIILFVATPGIMSAQYSRPTSVVAVKKINDTTIRTGRMDMAISGTMPSDTVISKLTEKIQKNWLPYNGMPNAITQKLPPDVYVGNNGKGQDIYQSQLDNMPILKPDSSFYSIMPMHPSVKPVRKTLKFPGMVTPGPEWVLPKNYKAPK